MLKNIAAFLLLLLPFTSFAQHIEILQQGQPTSIRGLSVVDDNIAWISGSKGHIAITKNGGKTWSEVFHDNTKGMFLDAMDFDTPKHGFVMGDPINDKYLLLETKDGGNNWNAYSAPDAIKNQAAFAASGTCLVTKEIFAIATGGSVAEIIRLRARLLGCRRFLLKGDGQPVKRVHQRHRMGEIGNLLIGEMFFKRFKHVAWYL